jgi:allantoicase
MPGRGKDMGDGWETRRRRGLGHDWVILKLGIPGVIRRIEVDTAHFKGNYPDRCSIESLYVEDAAKDEPAMGFAVWKVVLPEVKLKANRRHFFSRQLERTAPATHVRFNIFPDGGVSRLRIFGRAEHPGGHWKGIARFNQLSRAQARKALYDCCASKKWVEQMIAQRPFPSTANLLDASDRTWSALGRQEWLRAFRHHPAIGERRAKGKQSRTARRWSMGEQSLAQEASAGALRALIAANRTYQAKFGHVFLICASGKSTEEILRNLQERMSNEPELELRNAAREQRKITRLRLEKLLES